MRNAANPTAATIICKAAGVLEASPTVANLHVEDDDNPKEVADAVVNSTDDRDNETTNPKQVNCVFSTNSEGRRRRIYSTKLL